MKAGDKIRIIFHDHPEEMHTVGTVTSVMVGGVVKATIDDPEHPLHTHHDKPRELTIAPGNYEAV